MWCRDYDPERTMGDWRSGPRAQPEAQARARPMERDRDRDRERDRERDCKLHLPICSGIQ